MARARKLGKKEAFGLFLQKPIKFTKAKIAGKRGKRGKSRVI